MKEEKLNPKDFMLGDWVKEIYEGIDGNIHELERQISTSDFRNADRYIPIPITPEILEKNGFVQNKDSYLCKLSDKDSKIAIAYSDLYLDIRRTNPIMTIMVQCMYVHELQHALRLCGIDKEIIL